MSKFILGWGFVASIVIGCGATTEDQAPVVDDDTLAPRASTPVTICHVPPGNPAAKQTLVVGSPAVAKHLAHGDTVGPCGQEQTGTCPCIAPASWQLLPFGGLYCSANVPGGRLSVCSTQGQPACVAFAGDQSTLPLADCAACLPAALTEQGPTITSCSQVPGLLPL